MRKRPFRLWGYVFAFSIVIFILFGILITRSGILESVHAYASGTMGPVLTILVLGHLTIVLIFSILRRDLIRQGISRNKDGFQNKLFRWFNLCIIGLVLIYLFGQTLPLTSQVVYGEKVSFRPEMYEQISAPLLFILCLLTALCPHADLNDKNKAAFWRKTIILAILACAFPIAALFVTSFSLTIVLGFWITGFLLLSWVYSLWADHLYPSIKSNTARKPGSKIGMLLIHLGLAIMAVGILGVETMTAGYDRSIAPDASITLDNVTFTSTNRERIILEDGNVDFKEHIEMAIATNRQPKTIVPTIHHLSKFGTLYTEPVVNPGFLRDIQIVLKDIPSTSQSAAEFRITFFPLMSWIWVGGALMSLGGFISLILGKRPAK